MKKIIVLVSILCIGFISNARMASTLAGGFSFADGNGISAHFNSPNRACSDSSGNIYVADTNNYKIRKITFVPQLNPVSVSVPPNINCSTNNGFSVFDLTINNSNILGLLTLNNIFY